MKAKYLLSICLSCLLPFSSCEEDEHCKNCDDEQTSAHFDNMYLRFLITDAELNQAAAIFLNLDTTSNIATEYKSCVMHEYGVLENTKIIKADGRLFTSCDNKGVNFLKIDSYNVVDYCLPSYEVINGEFSLQNTWQIYSITTPDTVLYVPCEAYPDGAGLEIDENTISGYTCINGFAGTIAIISPNEFVLDNIVVGLFAGTDAQHLFQSNLLRALPPHTTLAYVKENNVLMIKNPLNNYSLKLFSL